jgi:glycosyltransferase involved in cell wall biosynthesis
MSLTVVIPAYNEEKDIERTLRSITFADEIIVLLDQKTSDATGEIAKKHGASVIPYTYESFCKMRNEGDFLATSDWVFSIEADVVVTPALAAEIKSVTSGVSDIKAYYLGRENIIWGKTIRYTDWGPGDDRHIWLYQKGVGKWQSAVHEEFVTNKKTGELKNHLLHYNYETVSEFIDKVNSVSEKALVQNNKPDWTRPLYDFFKRYFYKLGLLDGYHGLFLSYLQAIYYLTLNIKIRQKRYTQSR